MKRLIPRPRLTKKEKARIINMYLAGEKVEVIATIVGHCRTTIQRLMIRAAVPRRHPGGQIPRQVESNL